MSPGIPLCPRSRFTFTGAIVCTQCIEVATKPFYPQEISRKCRLLEFIFSNHFIEKINRRKHNHANFRLVSTIPMSFFPLVNIFISYLSTRRRRRTSCNASKTCKVQNAKKFKWLQWTWTFCSFIPSGEKSRKTAF